MTYKFQQIKPQKARGVLKDSMWTDPNWVAEEKYDGDRRIAQFCGVRARFTGSKESVSGGFVEKTGNLPHLQNFPFSLDGTVLDGEILPPAGVKIIGGGSKYVTAIMGSKPEEAIRKQKERGWLRYVVFDCLYYEGRSACHNSLVARQSLAQMAVREWGNKHVSLAEQHGSTLSKSIFYAKILKRGGEGVVLKEVHSTYGNEKLWVKVKREWTADVILHSFTQGLGKYHNQIGAIVFSQYRGKKATMPVIVGQCSGVTDELRRQLTDHPHKYLGKVFRITHNGREPTGAFRHPRFDCWRPDKNPKDCVYDPEET